MKETDIIKKYFSPLAINFTDSLNFEDDAAILKNFKYQNFVVSVDNFIQGIHCPKFLNERLAISRAILCATSDLAAMGALPYCVLLSIAVPKKKNKNFFKNLVNGIKDASNHVDVKIAGGDLTSYEGPLALSITAIGKSNSISKILKRKGGKPGDYLAVTGFIGDAFIGLNLLQEKINTSNKNSKKKSVSSFLSPPQLHSFSNKLVKYANCCIDISDGLIEDIYKLGSLAECRINLNSKDIPLSDFAKQLIKNGSFKINDFLTAGDDYQLAFTFNKKNFKNIEKLSKKFKLKITVLGNLTDGEGVYLDKKKISGGFSHF